jgi:Fe-Mn family superoxide dismutase
MSEMNIEQILKNLNEVPQNIYHQVRNNAGGHYNHTIFWSIMGQNKGGNPVGALGQKIIETFGNVEKFKEDFAKAALGRFGSGWAWLVLDGDGKISITSTPNQDNPISENLKPIIGIDVWEHAYYLKYQNRRAEYIEKLECSRLDKSRSKIS